MLSATVFDTLVPKATYDTILWNVDYNDGMDTLSSLPIAKSLKDNATVYMTTDTGHFSDTVHLIDALELKYQNSALTVDISEPLQTNAETNKTGRVKTVDPFDHWKSEDGMTPAISRSTTESLWYANKGTGADVSAKYKTVPFELVSVPELSKAKNKPRSQMGKHDRPSAFLELVQSAHKGQRILVLLTHSPMSDLDTLCEYTKADGTTTALVYVPHLNSSDGIVGELKTAIGGVNKTLLRTLLDKVRKSPEDSQVTDIVSQVTAPLEKEDILFILEHICVHLKSALDNKKKRKRTVGELSDTLEEINKKPRKKSGFAAESKISAKLAEFLGVPPDTEIARTQVVKELHKYFKANNIRSSEKPSELKADAKLKKLFGDDFDIFTTTSFNKNLNEHILKKEKPAVEVVEDVEETKSEQPVDVNATPTDNAMQT